MRRAFDVDVLACPRCGGRLRLIATVEDPEAIPAILAPASRDEAGRVVPRTAFRQSGLCPVYAPTWRSTTPRSSEWAADPSLTMEKD
jgi:hypothetical protein